MIWVIDRLEEGLAVLENTENLENIVCPVTDLPDGAREGDTLTREGTRFLLNPEVTAARSRRIREKMERLKKKDKPNA